MGQGDEAWSVVCEGGHGVRHALACGRSQKVVLNVAANEQGQLHVWHVLQQPVVPQRGAFAARWQVATAAFAGIAVTHGHDGHLARVVENFWGEVEPTAQQLAAGIVPGNAALVDFGAGGLAHNEQARRGTGLHDGARAQRQVGSADAAGAYFRQQ